MLRAPLQARAQLTRTVADDFVHGGVQLIRSLAVLLIAGNRLRVGSKFLDDLVPRGRGQSAAGRSEQEVLGPVPLANLIFVRKIVADGGYVEIAGFRERFHR